MVFYYSFLLALLLTAVAFICFCRARGRRFLLWWIPLALGLGVVSNFVQWHSPTRFHVGQGSPFPIVVFEREKTGSYVDFPIPLAALLNPVAAYCVGLAVWLAAWLFTTVIRYATSGKQPDTV